MRIRRAVSLHSVVSRLQENDFCNTTFVDSGIDPLASGSVNKKVVDIGAYRGARHSIYARKRINIIE